MKPLPRAHLAFYVAPLGVKNASKTDLSRWVDHFEFRSLVPGKRRRIQSPLAIANSAAAAFAKMAETRDGAALLTAQVRAAHELAHGRLVNGGCVPISCHEIRTLSNGASMFILVFGCQHQPMRIRRVRAAGTVIQELGTPGKLVLSGGRPRQKVVNCWNEARDMREMLEGMVSRHALKGCDIMIDERATETSSNLSLLTAENVARGTTLFAVSSLFHLPRIASLLLDHLKKHRDVRRRVDRVILVSSESRWMRPDVNGPRDVQSLLFEAFRFVFEVGDRARHSVKRKNRSVGPPTSGAVTFAPSGNGRVGTAH